MLTDPEARDGLMSVKMKDGFSDLVCCDDVGSDGFDGVDGGFDGFDSLNGSGSEDGDSLSGSEGCEGCGASFEME